MAKLAILAAVLVALLALAEASIYRTTITTTIEEENPGQGGSQSRRCMQQIQQQRQQLQHCQQYLSSPFDALLALNTDVNPHLQHLEQCCEALREIQDEQCRCEAVRQAFRQQQQQGTGSSGGQGQGQQQRQEQARQKARYLPSRCNVGPQECQI